jgi:hypothetical protein
LIQIVLSGQPELDHKIRQPELRQLRQRIALRCRTAALSAEETGAYVESRLSTAGARGAVFSPDALTAVHFYSRGIPRVINLLCEHALIGASVRGVSPVSAQLVEEVAREFQFDEFRPIAPSASSYSTSANLLSMEAPTPMPMTAPVPWSLALKPSQRPHERFDAEPSLRVTASANNSSRAARTPYAREAQPSTANGAPSPDVISGSSAIPSAVPEDDLEQRPARHVQPVGVTPAAKGRIGNGVAAACASFADFAGTFFASTSEAYRRNSASFIRWLRQPMQPARSGRTIPTKQS